MAGRDKLFLFGDGKPNLTGFPFNLLWNRIALIYPLGIVIYSGEDLPMKIYNHRFDEIIAQRTTLGGSPGVKSGGTGVMSRENSTTRCPKW